MTRHTTIADVAKAAGVSVTTVSRVINGNYQKMRPATRQQVEETIQRLNYVPTASAQRLRQAQGHVIGMLVGDISNPFSSLLAKGINDILQPAGYDILLMNTNNNPTNEARSLQRLYQERVDGILIQPSDRHFRQLSSVTTSDIPFVIVDRELADCPESIDVITSANQDACYQLCQLLAGHGYQNILSISSLLGGASSQLPRINGLQVAAHKQQLYYQNININGYDQQWLTTKLDQELKQLTGKTAVISLMGPILFDLLATMKQLGLSFPHDLGLVSFDDWEWSQYVDNGIFLLKQNMKLMGQLAAQRLLAQISGNQESGTTTLLPVDFIAHPSI